MQCDALLPILMRAGCGTAIGKDLFIDYMPADVQQGIAIYSPLAGAPINWELGPNYRHLDHFQVLVRANTRSSGLTLALKAVSALTLTTAQMLPATNNAPQMNLQFMRPIHQPIVYPRQANHCWECSTNFETTYAIINPINEIG